MYTTKGSAKRGQISIIQFLETFTSKCNDWFHIEQPCCQVTKYKVEQETWSLSPI